MLSVQLMFDKIGWLSTVQWWNTKWHDWKRYWRVCAVRNKVPIHPFSATYPHRLLTFSERTGCYFTPMNRCAQQRHLWVPLIIIGPWVKCFRYIYNQSLCFHFSKIIIIGTFVVCMQRQVMLNSVVSRDVTPWTALGAWGLGSMNNMASAGFWYVLLFHPEV